MQTVDFGVSTLVRGTPKIFPLHCAMEFFKNRVSVQSGPLMLQINMSDSNHVL